MASAPLAGPVPWTVAWRFLRHRRSRLLDGTARAALAATALGVTAMVIAMALMSGYREDLQAKLLSGNAAVLAYPIAPGAGGADLPAEAIAELEGVAGVVRVGQVAYAQGALSAAEHGDGGEARQVEVTLRGVEPGAGVLAASAVQLAAGEDGVPGTVLGSELARALGVGPGDALRLVVLGFRDGRPRFRYASLRATGTFSSGFAEFDRSWVVMDRRQLRELTGAEGATDLVEVVLSDPDLAPRVVSRAQEALGDDYVVTDARELNRGLFTALKLQQILLFLLLGCIVAVSTFNTASTLVVLVRERMRDIGVLATLGVTPGGLRAIFLLYGGLLGIAGTLVGVILGSSVAWAMTELELIRFDPEVAAIYFLSSVPFRVEAKDLLAIVGFTLTITLAACLLPAWLAARLDPAAALRYE
ncbi:MAG TPA: ABC transporter permease [Thermoanaerobaculia bacterium]|nr:ABC transporter permease [Thermoanaerobaculia bacterium]